MTPKLPQSPLPPQTVTPDIPTLLSVSPVNLKPESFADEQHKDPDLLEVFSFIQKEELLLEKKRAGKIALQS